MISVQYKYDYIYTCIYAGIAGNFHEFHCFVPIRESVFCEYLKTKVFSAKSINNSFLPIQ